MPVAWDVDLLSWLLLLEGSLLLQLHKAVGDGGLDLILTLCCWEHTAISHLGHDLVDLGLAEQFGHDGDWGSSDARRNTLWNGLLIRHMVVHVGVGLINGFGVK